MDTTHASGAGMFHQLNSVEANEREAAMRFLAVQSGERVIYMLRYTTDCASARTAGSLAEQPATRARSAPPAAPITRACARWRSVRCPRDWTPNRQKRIITGQITNITSLQSDDDDLNLTVHFTFQTPAGKRIDQKLSHSTKSIRCPK